MYHMNFGMCLISRYESSVYLVTIRVDKSFWRVLNINSYLLSYVTNISYVKQTSKNPGKFFFSFYKVLFSWIIIRQVYSVFL